MQWVTQIGPLDQMNLEGIHWVIVGGESGYGARPVQEEWVINVKNQCLANGVAFFFKQWGGVQKHRTGRILEGSSSFTSASHHNTASPPARPGSPELQHTQVP